MGSVLPWTVRQKWPFRNIFIVLLITDLRQKILLAAGQYSASNTDEVYYATSYEPEALKYGTYFNKSLTVYKSLVVLDHFKRAQ